MGRGPSVATAESLATKPGSVVSQIGGEHKPEHKKGGTPSKGVAFLVD